MASQITADLPTLDFPREVDYPTQEDWAAFSAAAELNFGILGGDWSTQMQLWKTQANAMSTELNTNADIAQGLANYQGDWISQGYTLGQTVSVGEVYYICKLTHSTGQNPTTSGSIYWNLALGNWNLKVNNYGDETISGIKTFSLSPIVPTPTTGTQVANKAYVDESIALKTIATGTATFTATTNNINLTGIGIGVEIGDVIQISGAIDAKNNSEFTVEVITDANNIIVNQAHANKGTTKNLVTRASDTGVTVKLLAKWYNAHIGLGQDWINVTSVRTPLTNYPPLPNRDMIVNSNATPSQAGYGVRIMQGGKDIGSSFMGNTVVSTTFTAVIKYDAGVYSWSSSGGTMTLQIVMELR